MRHLGCFYQSPVNQIFVKFRKTQTQASATIGKGGIKFTQTVTRQRGRIAFHRQ